MRKKVQLKHQALVLQALNQVQKLNQAARKKVQLKHQAAKKKAQLKHLAARKNQIRLMIS